MSMQTLLRPATWWALVGSILLGSVSMSASRPYRAPASANRDSLLRILSAENQRTSGDSYLASAIHHPTPSVRQAAIYAVARIGDAGLLDALAGQLNQKRNPNKTAVAFALGLFPDEMALTIAVQHLAMQQDPDVLAELYTSIGRAGGEKQLPLFARALQTTTNARVLEGICLGLGHLWAKDSENWAVIPEVHPLLIQKIRQNDKLALACSFALSRFKGLPSHFPPSDTVKAAKDVQSKEAAALLIRTLTRITTPESTAHLIQKCAAFSPVGIRIEAIKAISQHAVSKPILAALKPALDSPQNHVVFQALDAIQNYAGEAADLSDAVVALYKKTPSVWIRGKALKAGMAIDPGVWKPLVLIPLADPKSPVRPQAAGALAMYPNAADSPMIVTLLNEDSPRLVNELLESLGGWPSEAFTPEIKTALKTLLQKKDPAAVSSIAGIVERLKWKDFAESLMAVYPSLTRPDLVESKVAVLAALESLGQSNAESAATPANGKPTPFSFTGPELAEVAKAKVLLRTQRGEILLRMLPDAPLNGVHFLRLVKNKFYDGLTFHRVVPNFVVQGGDPRGDGFGGPGYLMRDEVSRHSHRRGTVGLATSGKDTGGSQFFFNLAPNLHLDGKYTAFAEVLRGMDVADRLEGGDKILSARVTY